MVTIREARRSVVAKGPGSYVPKEAGKSMNKTGTIIQKNEIISKHLPYEIDMLRYAYRKLQSASHDPETLNVLIECFCVHA